MNIYIINIKINNNENGEYYHSYKGTYNNVFYCLNDAIEIGKQFIYEYVLNDQDNEDDNDIIDCYNKYDFDAYNYSFVITTISTERKYFYEELCEESRKYVYDNYLKTNSLVNSLLLISNAKLYYDYNGILIKTKWELDSIECPFNYKDLKYNYSIGDIVKYNNGIYRILDTAKDLDPLNILNENNIEIYHSYMMEGIEDNEYRMIRCDDNIPENYLISIGNENNKFIELLNLYNDVSLSYNDKVRMLYEFLASQYIE